MKFNLKIVEQDRSAISRILSSAKAGGYHLSKDIITNLISSDLPGTMPGRHYRIASGKVPAWSCFR